MAAVIGTRQAGITDTSRYGGQLPGPKDYAGRALPLKLLLLLLLLALSSSGQVPV